MSSFSACEEYASKAKGKILDLMKTMWSLGSLNTTVFFQLFDAQIKPMLLYASEIWGTSKHRITESAHLFACKRLLSLSDKSPNHMVSVNKRFQPENAIKTCPFCPGVLEDEIHFLFICPVYAVVRHKYLKEFTDNDVEPTLNSVFENPSIDANRKVAMFAFYALKRREEMLAS